MKPQNPKIMLEERIKKILTKKNLNSEDLDTVSKLQKTHRYVDIMQKVEEALALGMDSNGTISENSPEYKLIVDCNQLSVDIDNEIVIVHNFIRHKYRPKFPELESLVAHATDYARVVKQIGNKTDLTSVDLERVLTRDKPKARATITPILLLHSTTKGKSMPEDVLQKTIEACDHAIDLDSARDKILEFVITKMGCLAPNLSAIVGSDVAAKLLVTAGGLSALAKLPSCNVQLLGHKRKNLAGFSTASSQCRVGYLDQTDILQKTPPGLRSRVIRFLAGKSVLAARSDAARGDTSGTYGKALREEIVKKIEKLQEPGVARQPKSLPVPDMEPKKRRGGRRLRKMKERYAVTEMRKLSNRVAFGVTAEESSLGDGLGVGYGMLGHAQSNRLRVSAVQSKLKVNAKLMKKLKERRYTSGTSTSSSGLMSSLAFNSVQGIELCNPQAQGLSSGTQSTYFADSGTFSSKKK
ncbi:unnamed protein product [Microthlaspi erraticum]|uniref:Nop domain-containing protein n=1 Tax=Microthlaspi erraticum TaxID=1685480 RepID=A0A6D2ISX0_9BRAS|nr:unnamed protein product [Microthlaspi erraticum]